MDGVILAEDKLTWLFNWVQFVEFEKSLSGRGVLNQEVPVASSARQNLQDREGVDLLRKLGAILQVREIRADRRPRSAQVEGPILAIDAR